MEDQLSQSIHSSDISYGSNGMDIESQREILPSLNSIETVKVYVFEDETLWHLWIPKDKANCINCFFRSCTGLIFTLIIIVAYCFGLFTFDTGLWGNFPIIYSMIIIIPSFIISILYFGTLNYEIGKKLISDFPFWFKMFNIFISNAMSVIWAIDNISFNNHSFINSKQLWFAIFGIYFLTNIIVTSMGCLLDGFSWGTKLKTAGPLFLGGYLLHSWYYWHFTDNYGTEIKMNIFGYHKEWSLAYIAASADLNAALFLFSQAWISFRDSKRVSLFSPNAQLVWKKTRNDY
mmetsp:Transcript_10966/g.13681  ORF Transcript_10966/g.13681 Transcript_10966/m.13681 type:complete len:290 (+) Transcript_10966:113-982(+)